MRKLLLTVSVLALSAGALADWNDGFEGYNPGPIVGQGGWEGWGGDAGATGYVTTAIARTGTQSQEVHGNSDSVHQYSGYTSGHWLYTAWQYIPGNLVGKQYFIMMNRYVPPSGYNWSVQLTFDPVTDTLSADAGSSNPVVMPYVADQWVPITVDVDLNTDWAKVYYNGVLIDDPALPGQGYQWTKGVFGADIDGQLNIAAVDLYAGAPQTPVSTPVYYDDMSLTVFPEPAALGVLLLAVALRRR